MNVSVHTHVPTASTSRQTSQAEDVDLEHFEFASDDEELDLDHELPLSSNAQSITRGAKR